VYCNSLGPNSDGFDPESCDQVLVENCTFDTGDDCIAIKAGKNLDTNLGPSQNIVIQNCVMQSGHGGVTLGSEMSAGIKNIYVQDLLMENKNWKTNPLNTAIRLKTNMNRGGYLKDFYVRRIKVPNGVKTIPSFYKSFSNSPISEKTVPTEAGSVITFDCDYSSTKDNIRTRPPKISNIHISDVNVGNVITEKGEFSCYQPIVILGPVKASFNGPDPNKEIFPVFNVTVQNCDFGKPASGDEKFFLYNVKNLNLINVTINGKKVNQTFRIES
jgi:polygalacturonase